MIELQISYIYLIGMACLFLVVHTIHDFHTTSEKWAQLSSTPAAWNLNVQSKLQQFCDFSKMKQSCGAGADNAWLCNRRIALLLARKAQVEFEHSQLLDMAKEKEAAHRMLGIPVEVTFQALCADKAHQTPG